MPDQKFAPTQVVLSARGAPAPGASAQPAGSITAPLASSNGSDISKWLILADQSGVGSALAEQLEAAGHECAVIHTDRHRDLPGLLESHAFDGVVHLWALDAAPASDLTAERLQEALWLVCDSAVEVLQELLAPTGERGPRIWFATQGAQPVAAGDRLSGLAQSPLWGLAQSPLWGLARTVADEQPALWGGLVDLDPAAEPRASAAALAAELLGKGQEDQVAYRTDQRYAARLVRRPRGGWPHHPVRWRTDASYLITGGLGDVGLRVAEWMAEQGAHHLILTGRTPLPPREAWDELIHSGSRQGLQVQVLRRLEARGVTIRVAVADVTDEAAMRKLLESLAAEGWPPIRGVFHAAGQADAQPLTTIRPEHSLEVIGPKMAGAWLLHKLLEHEPLDFFVCCSSAAAILPSALMGVNAAASSFPVALAYYRRAAGLPALTVQWGFWEQTANLSPALHELGPGMMPAGMRSFTTGQGLAALQMLVEQGAVTAAVMPVDLAQWQRQHPYARHSSLLANLRLTELEPEPSAAAGESSPREAMLAAPPQARRELVEGYLRERLSRVLGVPSEKLDAQQSLNDLGIDSLMAVELRNHVQAHLSVTIPMAKLMQDPTLAQLAQVVLDQLGSSPPEPVQATATGPRTKSRRRGPPLNPIPNRAHASAEETLAQIHELSDDQVDALLRRMLSEEEQQA